MCASVVTLSGTESRSWSVGVLIAAEIELAIYKWFIQAERQGRQSSQADLRAKTTTEAVLGIGNLL